MNKIKLGLEVKDKVTGFKGIVIGQTKWLTGCDQSIVKAKAKADALPLDGQWFDDGQLDVIGEGIDAKDVQTKKPGGPKRNETRKC